MDHVFRYSEESRYLNCDTLPADGVRDIETWLVRRSEVAELKLLQ